jgi:GNAT superfamily N-acetyltransferase
VAASGYVLRAATPADVEAVLRLIKGLADYERLAEGFTATAERLHEHLFGPRPYADVVLADVGRRSVGFALFFHSYSTFLAAPGLYLEDLFVEPEHRGRGIGGALLRHVARVAVERGCGRLEWAVLDWNAPAMSFYVKQGAAVLPDWRICRVTGDTLRSLGGLTRPE